MDDKFPKTEVNDDFGSVVDGERVSEVQGSGSQAYPHNISFNEVSVEKLG